MSFRRCLITVIDFRHGLFSMISATEVSITICLCEMKSRNFKNGELRRYLNPVRDLAIYCNKILDACDPERQPALLGQDVFRLLSRIRDPIEYWKMNAHLTKMTVIILLRDTSRALNVPTYPILEADDAQTLDLDASPILTKPRENIIFEEDWYVHEHESMNGITIVTWSMHRAMTIEKCIHLPSQLTDLTCTRSTEPPNGISERTGGRWAYYTEFMHLTQCPYGTVTLYNPESMTEDRHECFDEFEDSYRLIIMYRDRVEDDSASGVLGEIRYTKIEFVLPIISQNNEMYTLGKMHNSRIESAITNLIRTSRKYWNHRKLRRYRRNGWI